MFSVAACASVRSRDQDFPALFEFAIAYHASVIVAVHFEYVSVGNLLVAVCHTSIGEHGRVWMPGGSFIRYDTSDSRRINLGGFLQMDVATFAVGTLGAPKQ